jgi:hypothetical protein
MGRPGVNEEPGESAGLRQSGRWRCLDDVAVGSLLLYHNPAIARLPYA